MPYRAGPPPFDDPDAPFSTAEAERIFAGMRRGRDEVLRLPEPVVEWIKRFSPFNETPEQRWREFFRDGWEAERKRERARAAIPAPTTPLKRLTLEAWVAAAVKRFPKGPVESLRAWSRRLLPQAKKDGFHRSTAESIETRIHEMRAKERREEKERREKERRR
jgi:hypothetical protein